MLTVFTSRFSQRNVLIGLMIVFSIAQVLCAIAPDYGPLLAARGQHLQDRVVREPVQQDAHNRKADRLGDQMRPVDAECLRDLCGLIHDPT